MQLQAKNIEVGDRLWTVPYAYDGDIVTNVTTVPHGRLFVVYQDRSSSAFHDDDVLTVRRPSHELRDRAAYAPELLH